MTSCSSWSAYVIANEQKRRRCWQRNQQWQQQWCRCWGKKCTDYNSASPDKYVLDKMQWTQSTTINHNARRYNRQFFWSIYTDLGFSRRLLLSPTICRACRVHARSLAHVLCFEEIMENSFSCVEKAAERVTDCDIKHHRVDLGWFQICVPLTFVRGLFCH